MGRQMQSKPWNTMRLALFGAAAGAVYGLFNAFPLLSGGPESVARALGGITGSAVVLSFMVAVVSVIRNRFVR